LIVTTMGKTFTMVSSCEWVCADFKTFYRKFPQVFRHLRAV